MATFDFDGREVTAITGDDLTLGELTYVLKHYGINGRVALDASLEALEPVALRALLIAAVRRDDPEVDAWDERVNDVAISPLLAALETEALAAVAEGDGN